MSKSSIEIPPDITFETAIALTQSLLDQVEAGTLSPTQIADALTKLVKSENGARGFFVIYLTSERTLADYPSPEVVQALQSSPDIVAELLAKNLAMSAVMALTHHQNGNEEMAQSSAQVRERTAHLIELVKLNAVYEHCQKLLESATTGDGSYKAFLERQGYDAEQRQLMCQALQSVLPQ